MPATPSAAVGRIFAQRPAVCATPSNATGFCGGIRPSRFVFVLSALVCIYLFFHGAAFAADPITATVDAVLARPELKEARVGVLVYDLDAGMPVYAHNADESFTPASNAKLLTAAAALDALGPDYVFRTAVLTDTAGDLVVRGGGDPTLTTQTLDRWAVDLTQRGLTRVPGDVIVDASFFPPEVTVGQTGEPTGGDETDTSQPVVGAWSANQNRVTLIVGPGGAVGAQADVRRDPSTPYPELYNLAVTGPAGGARSLTVTQEPAGRWRIEGQIPLGGSPSRRDVTVDEPGLYAGEILRQVLAARGVRFGEASRVRYGLADRTAAEVSNYGSAPLKKVLAKMLKDSDNFMAEQLLRTLGRETGGTGAPEGGLAAIERFLQAHGLTMPHRLVDACGLSGLNQVTPELLVRLLAVMDAHPHGHDFRQALAVAGVDGTLASRMKGAGGRVIAKTGSLLIASTLSGYATTPEGRRLAFAVLMNLPSDRGWPRVLGLRPLQDQIVLALLK
jgi:serine-type D-Ala-D-Ala carboxypeptidase/endopeptidase (penicillin-binding protein 4)